jgi:hypothetical protein
MSGYYHINHFCRTISTFISYKQDKIVRTPRVWLNYKTIDIWPKRYEFESKTRTLTEKLIQFFLLSSLMARNLTLKVDKWNNGDSNPNLLHI